MKPIVHGLERKYSGRVDFLYLNTGDATTRAAQSQLGFKTTPHIILVHRDGAKFREWTGLPSEAELTAGLDDLLRAQQPK